MTALRRIAAALTYRDFRVLWFGAFTSTIGTWMQKVAQNWLVLTITGSSSAFFLGLDSFLGELPILLFTLIGGVVADRRDRRQLLLASQYVQMTAAFTLAALVYFDVVRIWHVLALSVMTGLAQAFGGPAYQSLLPSLAAGCTARVATPESFSPRRFEALPMPSRTGSRRWTRARAVSMPRAASKHGSPVRSSSRAPAPSTPFGRSGAEAPTR